MSIEKIVTQLIRPEIRALKAYHVPDARGLIKLDAMENPYTWPAALKQEWLEVLRDGPINRYPGPPAQGLGAQPQQTPRPAGRGGGLLGRRARRRRRGIGMGVEGPVAQASEPLLLECRGPGVRVLHGVELDEPARVRHVIGLERPDLRANQTANN